MSKQTQKLVRLKQKAKDLNDEERGRLADEYITGLTALVLATVEEAGDIPLNIVSTGGVEATVSSMLELFTDYAKEELGKDFNVHAHFVGVERSK